MAQEGLGPGAGGQLRQELKVTWYRPDYTSEKRDGQRGVVFSGKTKPGAQVLLGRPRITRYLEGQGVEYLDITKDLVGNLPSRADRFGLFYFEIYLEEGTYQLPVVIRDPRRPKDVNRYQISFHVEADRIRMGDDEEHDSLAFSPFLKKGNRLSVGYGANYLNYQQQIPSIERNIHFSSVKGPAFFLDYWHRFNPRWELAASYKSAPGSTTSGEDLVVRQGDYTWDIGTVDFLYFPERLFFEKPRSYRLRLGARVGAQYHGVPFLRAASTDSEVEVVTNPTTMVALGLQAEYETSPEWKYEAFVRYQHPLSIGDVFEATSSSSMDWSLGFQHNFPNYIWALGIYWYGQFQSYQFLIEEQHEIVAGEQKLFFSNLEIRLQYNF